MVSDFPDGWQGVENYLGRMEHGGWDCQMTSILEIYGRDFEDTAGDEQGICGGGAGDGVRRELPDERYKEGATTGGGEICPTLMAGESEIYVYEGVYDTNDPHRQPVRAENRDGDGGECLGQEGNLPGIDDNEWRQKGTDDSRGL